MYTKHKKNKSTPKFKRLPNIVPIICAVNAARGGNLTSKEHDVNFWVYLTWEKKKRKAHIEQSSNLVAIAEPD